MFDDLPRWLRKLGVQGWLLAGAAILVGGVLWFLGATSGISGPLVIAVVLGMLLYPLVDWLDARGVARPFGSVIVLLLVVAVASAATYVIVQGVIAQGDEIVRQARAGADALGAWIADLPLAEDTVDRIAESAEGVSSSIASGLLGFFTTGLSSLVSLVFGVGLSLFMFYYLLKDWHAIATWFGGTLDKDPLLGVELVKVGTRSTQQYFKALTISSAVVSIIIAGTMAVMGLPLAGSIGVVTMITSYIPFLGAFISGTFAFLIAFGSGGPTEAIIVLVVILVTQNVVQTVLLNKTASVELDIHPLVTLLSTLLGGTIAGVFGAALGTPLTAAVLRASARRREERPPDSPSSL